MPEREYKHFLMLFVAVRICSCRIYTKYFGIASKLFKMYVEEYESIHGRHNIGSNIHNLVHIIEDMENCNVGNLIDISTYKFENALRILGLKLKHTNRPLEQIVCRIVEENNLKSNSQVQEIRSTQFEPTVSYRFNLGDRNVFKKIEIAPNVFLSSRNWSIVGL